HQIAVTLRLQAPGLLQQAWGLQPESDSNLVDVYVNYLRKKIDRAGEEKLIHTVRGRGYRLGQQAPIVSSSESVRGRAEQGGMGMGMGQAQTQQSFSG